MRHQKSRYQLNRFTSWRKATLVSLAKNLLIHQSIKTTKVKAKAARRLVERLISLGKENTLSAKRRAYQILGEHRLVSLLFNEIASRFGNRNGGYTRILPLGRRRGDNASLVIFELTEKKVKKIVKKPKKEKEGVVRKEEVRPKEEIKEKPHTITALEEKERPQEKQKPTKGFLKGIRGIFKKERDAL
ncbi:MAG: 50S ribosomal protein L17 [Candidatus Omnitrophica bacterium]|nr:50S ribosomal protein L17 [Candidatus Omnitrophota bacterium]